MAITASMVKELRDATGAGMMDAKKALTETDGDFEAAVDWLRTKGLAKAAKKSGRVAAEGLVAVSVQSGTGVAVEVNSETDFVGKNAEFQTMVGSFAQKALDMADIDALAQADIDGKTVTEVLTDKIATIGENMSLRVAANQGEEHRVGAMYVWPQLDIGPRTQLVHHRQLLASIQDRHVVAPLNHVGHDEHGFSQVR